jgi:hypothetical protein
MKPIMQGSSRPNPTSRLNSLASAAPPVYRPNASPAVQRMEAPAVYRPNPAGTAQRMAASAVHSAQVNPLVQRAVAPPIYRPNPNAPVQRMAAPAVYMPNGAASMQRAAAPSAFPQPSTRLQPRSSVAQPVAQAKQVATTSVNRIAPKARPQSTTIQREIYKYKQDKWVLKKLGTPGTYQPPARPNGDNVYFNTVTNKEGSSLKDVEAGLIDLMIVKGSLKDLKGGLQWPDALWNGLQKGTDNGSVTTLGTIRLECDRKPVFKGLVEWLTPLWNDLLGPFMERNGQFPYIKGQDWYTSGWMVVDISVNFYNNRSAADATLGFHKDTAGDNLFVNLIFNNKDPILATEWVVDKRKMKAAKKRQMYQYTGSDELADAINATRASIVSGEYSPQGTDIIEGGIQTREAGFVSWVDELIWHSSPYEESRGIHRRTERMYNILSDPKNYRITTRKPKTFSIIREALKSLRRIPGTLINSFGKPAVKPLLWTEAIDQYIATIVAPGGKPMDPGWTTHVQDIKDNWRLIMPGLSRGEEQADDESNDNTNIRRFTDIAKLQRRNSIIAQAGGTAAGNLQSAANTKEPRSFIRTWVQIHREDYPLK